MAKKQPTRRIQADDLYKFKLITGLDLSPDGSCVIYAVQRVDQETEKKYSNLWLIPTAGGDAQQFTVGDHTDIKPAWSPDGRQIAFLSNRKDEKQFQLYLIPANGGEARALTQMEGAFERFAWSPDGSRILCQFRKKDEEVLEREADEKKKELGVVYRQIDRVRYSLDGKGYFPKERWHLWSIDVATGEATQLTEGDQYDEIHPAWTPDGESVVFLSNRQPDPDLEPDKIDLYVIPAAGGEMHRIPTPVGSKELPNVSPDGEWIVYIGREGVSDWWQNDELWIVPLAAKEKKQARNLTVDYDRTISTFTLNDLGGAEKLPPTWAPDGRRLYVQISHHGNTTLHAIDLAEDEVAAPKMTTVIGGPGVVGAYKFDAAHETLAYFRGEMFDPGQIWRLDLASGEEAKLTRLNAEIFDEVDLGQVEEVWFKGPDGNDLQGWMLTPPGFDPDQNYPSIMEIHGGPLAQYGNFFMHEFFYLAAQDHVVYFCNPRGGIGYGEAHAKAIWGAWGTKDYADLMAWADEAAARPYIDVERMGVTGGSYGGYMTAWIIGHTDRFAAAAAQRSVVNCISMWGSSDANWVFQQPWGDRPPYESIEQLWEYSPLKHLDGATTPTLVIHSERDLRCPLEQSQQLFVALKTMGVDTQLVLFPEEPHGLSRVGRTDRRIARLEHISGWFEERL